MDSRRLVIIYWVLLLIPSLAGGLAAWKLLGHEQERIHNNAKILAEKNADTIAGSISITVETMENVLLESLMTIDGDDLEKTLEKWLETNPLIRNFFIWQKKKKFIYPIDGIESTAEERKFIKRFETIFQTNPPWNMPKKDEKPVMERNSKIQLFDMARGEQRASSNQNMEKTGGWYPCFTENRLHIIGWVSQKKSDIIIGVELELVTILSRIVSDFKNYDNSSGTFALLNGQNEIIHQTDSREIINPLEYDIAIPLSKAMPHWSIAVFTDKNTLDHGNSFFYISMLISLIFFTAILSGGWFLVWLARKNMRDAQEKINFVSLVSHELKTPLTSIRMYAELLQSGRVSGPEKKKHYLDVIVSETRRLTRLINNVLDFSRLEQGKKDYHPETFDLAPFISELLSVHRLRINKAGLELDVTIPPGAYPVVSDRDCLEQVILNLIDNAMKYASEGKVLSVALAKKNDLYLITIQDNGKGIPEAHREKIFEKFHRIDNSLAGKQSGTGLGLSISRSLMRNIGGELILAEKKSLGSKFIITIPEK
jgi:signal transduction histidine kinase